MCPAHRQVVLERVRGRLAAGEPVFVVSTSLIEAGVDVDFPVVYRAMAPPDSQAQAAGRCNREGRLGPEGGLVVLFDPADGGAPSSYRTQVDKAAAYFGPGKADPDDLAALRDYFTALYRTLDLEGRGSVSRVIERHRWFLDFVGVADGPLRPGGRGRDRDKAFRLILEDTVPVVVAYGSPDERRMVRDGLAALRGPAPDPAAWRRLQPFTTTVRRRTAERPDVAALMSPGCR
jgi:CRISPR-associated endonuclease/helicase Cas3